MTNYRAELTVTFTCGLCSKDEVLVFELPCTRRTGQEVHIKFPGRDKDIHRINTTVQGDEVRVEGTLMCRKGHDICGECDDALDMAEAKVWATRKAGTL